jgi:hypothetical protein
MRSDLALARPDPDPSLGIFFDLAAQVPPGGLAHSDDWVFTGLRHLDLGCPERLFDGHWRAIVDGPAPDGWEPRVPHRVRIEGVFEGLAVVLWGWCAIQSVQARRDGKTMLILRGLGVPKVKKEKSP